MLEKIIPKNIEVPLLFLFILSIPLQARKVFLTSHSFYTGSFTEFGTFFFYLSDLLLLGAMGAYLLHNKTAIKNSLFKPKNKSGKSEKNKVLCLVLILSAWFFISALLSNPEYQIIAFFRSFKMLEMGLLAILLSVVWKNKSILSSSLFILVLSGIFQSSVALYQFIFQKSLFNSPFLHKITGESLISPDTPGVAKIMEDGEKIVRAYGTFPHPNILGGFLSCTILISLFLYLNNRYLILSSIFSYIKVKSRKSQDMLVSFFWTATFTLQLTALLVSYSRSAWIGTGVGLLLFAILSLKYTKIVSRETIFNRLALSEHKELVISTLIILTVLISTSNLFFKRIIQDVNHKDAFSIPHLTVLPQNDTFADRLFFNNVSRETISQHTFSGSGPGTSIFQINRFIENNKGESFLESWQYQPPHSIYMLAASETGLIGLFILLSIILQSLSYAFKKIVSRETILDTKLLKISALCIMISFMSIGLMDHYLITMHQGQIIFWITIILLII